MATYGDAGTTAGLVAPLLFWNQGNPCQYTIYLRILHRILKPPRRNLRGFMDGTDDDLSLPKATVQKLVGEMLNPDLSFGRESRDLLIECCVDFVHLISSEANEICEKETKKTIAGEHVTKALADLGFTQYLDKIAVVVNDHKNQLKAREKKVSKFESSGLSTEELLAQQEELLSQARNRFQAQGLVQQQQANAPTAGPSTQADRDDDEVKVEQE